MNFLKYILRKEFCHLRNVFPKILMEENRRKENSKKLGKTKRKHEINKIKKNMLFVADIFTTYAVDDVN